MPDEISGPDLKYGTAAYINTLPGITLGYVDGRWIIITILRCISFGFEQEHHSSKPGGYKFQLSMMSKVSIN
jgi:hypothetical protein